LTFILCRSKAVQSFGLRHGLSSGQPFSDQLAQMKLALAANIVLQMYKR
jgi:hypothetical protein